MTITTPLRRRAEVNYVAIFKTSAGEEAVAIVGFDRDTHKALVVDGYGYVVPANDDPNYLHNDVDTSGLAHGRSIVQRLSERPCEHSGNTSDTCFSIRKRMVFHANQSEGYCPPCLARLALDRGL